MMSFSTRIKEYLVSPVFVVLLLLVEVLFVVHLHLGHVVPQDRIVDGLVVHELPDVGEVLPDHLHPRSEQRFFLLAPLRQ